MKKNKFYYGFPILTVLALSFWIGCKKDNTLDNSYGINGKTNPDMVNEALRMPGKLIDGALPQSQDAGGVLIISNPEAVEVAAGIDVYIPYRTNFDNDIAKLYVQVEGAGSYWEIPPRIDGSNSGPLAMRIFIPNFVQIGDFNLNFSVQDKNGRVSPMVVTNTIVSSSLDCNAAASGSVGITVKVVDLGDKKGLVSMDYNTYSITDRIDIWYNNKWILSTGEVYNGYFPECTNYSQGSSAGFVSGTGLMAFDYDPKNGRYMAVYITGCDNGTRWDIQVHCPKENWLNELPDCPCTYQEMQAKDGIAENDGIWEVCGDASQDYHYGAAKEARWKPNISGAAGQQCTYDINGSLITSGIAAGSPDRVSPRACGWTWNLGNVKDHYFSDVLPWSFRSCSDYLNEWPANTGVLCTNGVAITTIDQCANMVALIGEMDCEDATLLIKSAKESTVIDPTLKALLTGGQNNSTNAELIGMLQAWRLTFNCPIIVVGGVCSVVDEAIANLQ